MPPEITTDNIIDLYKEIGNVRKVAKYYKINERKITAILKEKGVRLSIDRSNTKDPMAYSTEELQSLYQELGGLKQTAKYFSCGAMKMHGILKDKGVKTSTKLTIEECIRRSIAVHGGRYGYSECEKYNKYKNQYIKMNIMCFDHGEYQQSFAAHVHRNQGCPNCGKIQKAKSKTISTQERIKTDRETHGEKDDYSLISENKTANQLQKFICFSHGEYEQTFHARLSGQRCPKCGIEIIRAKKIKPIEDWIRRDKEIHGEKDDYSLVIAGISSSENQNFICLIHGQYELSFSERINRKRRCKKCSCKLRTETLVRKILETDLYPGNNFENVRPDWLINPKTNMKLELDCYNEKLKLAVEVNGRQHYILDSYNNTPDKLEYQKYKDQIKKEICYKRNIKLIAVHYNAFKYSNEKLKKYIIKKIKEANAIMDRGTEKQ
jgi:hypothetical protein